MVTPAEGPSLGMAPSGTCMWRSCVSKKALSGCGGGGGLVGVGLYVFVGGLAHAQG